GNPCAAGDACNNTCNEATDTCFSPAATACDDGAYCNGADTCDGAGTCANHAGDPCAAGNACNNPCNEATDTCFSPAATACDDGAFCNGADTCDGAGTCVSAGNPCAAGNACNNTCNEATDTCFSPAATPCDDGAFCNGADTCNGAGACVSAGNPCAGGPVCNNICNEAADNCLSPAATSCDDGAFCNGADTCNGAGSCANHVGDPCAAGNACNNTCNEATDTCFSPAATACDDGAFCNGADTCDGAGSCANHAGDPCAAGNACNNTCNEATDTCFSPAATPCDDGLFCNGADTCNGAGACGTHAGDPCLGGPTCQNICNEAADSCNSPAGTGCDDGVFCNGADTCDGAGACGTHAGDPCLGGPTCQNICTEAADNCNSPVGTGCDDGLFCNGADTCNGAGACGTHAGDPCLGGPTCQNTCNEAADNCNSPVGTGCDDGLFCNGADTCNGGGSCIIHAGDPCLGGPACQNICNEGADNCNSPVGTGCNDGLFCNGADTCDGAGSCGTHAGDPCLGGPICQNICNEAVDNCNSPAGTSCNDGVFCNGVDTCNGGGTCLHPNLANGTPCDDGDGDLCDSTCQAGACAGVPVTCPDDGDECNGVDTCVPATGLCAGGASLPDDTPCNGGDNNFCNSTCQATTCVAVPVDCNDGNPCTVDTCNIADGTCSSTSPNYNLNSPVGSTSDLPDPQDICLTAGSQAQYVIYVNLQDMGFNPLPGETVSIEARSGAAVWADTVTESSFQPGTYYRTLLAAPGAGNAEIEITLCAGSIVLNETVLVTYAPANPATRGGTGGCNPAAGFLVDGNLKVTVVEEETGNTISGARVMIDLAGNNSIYETNFEAWLGDGGASVPAPNTCVTDGNGVCEFYDYGANMYDVRTVTAGTNNRSYFTIVDTNASELILPLKELYPAENIVRWTNENTNEADRGGFLPGATLGAGLALPILDLSFFSRCEITALMEPSRCVSLNGTPTEVPENFFMPRHNYFIGGQITPRVLWNLSLDQLAHDPQSVSMPFGEVPLTAATAGWIEILRRFQYSKFGFLLDHATVNDIAGKTINLNENFPYRLNVTVNTPIPNCSDLLGVTGGDYDAQLGSGDLFMMGHAISLYNVWANCNTPGVPRTMSIPVSDLNAAGSPNPAGITMLAGIGARFMEDDPARPYVVPASLRWAATGSVYRDNGSGGAPFNGTANSTWSVTDLLDFAALTFTGPGSFRWDDTTSNGTVPDYSVHHLNVDTLTYPPPPCPSIDQRTFRRTKSVQWVVVRPFEPTCAGGSECFVLPTLPAGWPRQGTGAAKRDGFDLRYGSGLPCSIDANCNTGIGEVCRDVDNTLGPGGLQCAIISGSDYEVQRYYWWPSIYRLGLTTFDFDAFAFEDDVTYRTEQSSNELDFSN
ncbi:MAG: hypothetical protein ABI333_02910, partial [bacterium]